MTDEEIEARAKELYEFWFAECANLYENAGSGIWENQGQLTQAGFRCLARRTVDRVAPAENFRERVIETAREIMVRKVDAMHTGEWWPAIAIHVAERIENALADYRKDGA